MAERVVARPGPCARREACAANADLAGTDARPVGPARPPRPHDLLATVLRSGRLSARGLARVRRVALTLADLAGHEGPLTAGHVGTALQLRADVGRRRGLAA